MNLFCMFAAEIIERSMNLLIKNEQKTIRDSVISIKNCLIIRGKPFFSTIFMETKKDIIH